MESGIDENFLTGLRSVIRLLDKIFAEASSFARRMESELSHLPHFEPNAMPPLSRDPSSAGEEGEDQGEEEGEEGDADGDSLTAVWDQGSTLLVAGTTSTLHLEQATFQHDRQSEFSATT